MLSRVAESIYWMSRYIERAENVARFVDVNLHLILDMPVGMQANGNRWSLQQAMMRYSPNSTAMHRAKQSFDFWHSILKIRTQLSLVSGLPVKTPDLYVKISHRRCGSS